MDNKIEIVSLTIAFIEDVVAAPLFAGEDTPTSAQLTESACIVANMVPSAKAEIAQEDMSVVNVPFWCSPFTVFQKKEHKGVEAALKTYEDTPSATLSVTPVMNVLIQNGQVSMSIPNWGEDSAPLCKELADRGLVGKWYLLGVDMRAAEDTPQPKETTVSSLDGESVSEETQALAEDMLAKAEAKVDAEAQV